MPIAKNGARSAATRSPRRAPGGSHGRHHAMAAAATGTATAVVFESIASTKRASEAAHVPGVARGLAAGDLDNDGAIDLVVIQRNGPVRVLRNVAGTMGGWIQMRLVDAQGREVRNAVVSLHSGSSVQWRQAQPNEGYCSSNDPRLHFGLGNATRADRVVVRWPRRPPEEFGPLDARRIHVLQVGTGRAPAKP